MKTSNILINYKGLDMKQCTCSRSLSEDFEKVNPCFFESRVDEEFYDAPTPGPSEDIWKKFELLPTPPRSPHHETNYPLAPSTLDKLQLVSDTLEDFDMDYSLFPEDCQMCKTLSAPTTPSNKNESSLKSNLIQDCMWSGLNIVQDLKLSTKTQKPECDKSNTGITLCTPSKSTTSSQISSSMDINSSTECVDPTAVFPYPLNDTRDSLGAETPSDSEDEEIDVVTVNDKVQITRRKPILPAAPTMSAQVAAMHNYTAPAPVSPPPVIRTTSSNTTPLRSTTSPRTPRHSHKRSRSQYSPVSQPIKRIRISLPRADLQSVVHKLGKHNHHRHGGHSSGGSSRSSSDSEDGERRSQHNILERKRRNDLKYSFHRLRDNVPDLGTQEKAPKVTILKKATDFIYQLRRTEKAYKSEMEQLQQRKDQLRRRLSALQRI